MQGKQTADMANKSMFMCRRCTTPLGRWPFLPLLNGTQLSGDQSCRNATFISVNVLDPIFS
jgi:hypothetical protein